MRWLAPLFLLSFGFVLSAEEAIRTWTDLKGRTMEARFIRFTGDKMVIKRADGRSFTVMPDLFSEVDRKYVEEMRGKVGADGKPWDKSSAIQALVSGKWLDHTEEQIPYRRNYWEFKRSRVDLNDDGKFDGYEVSVRANAKGAQRKVHAWDVNDDGDLTIHWLAGYMLREVFFEYDHKSSKFVMKKGGALAKYLKSAKRQIEK
jgi:hypothetical protein